MQVFSKLARCETRNGFGHDRYSKMVLVAVSSHIYMSFSKSWSSIRSLDAIRFDNVAGRTLDCDRVPTHGDLLCALSAATESSWSPDRLTRVFRFADAVHPKAAAAIRERLERLAADFAADEAVAEVTSTADGHKIRLRMQQGRRGH